MKPQVIFLVGPTACGKSKLGIALAKRFGAEIVSADSMQVYRDMDIGTAKPTAAQRRSVRHHLMDFLSPSRSFSVFEYRKQAIQKIRDIVRCGKVPIVVGGSGLYVRALLEGLSGQPGANHPFRKRLQAEAKTRGLAVLYDRLMKLDSIAAKKIGPKDQKRIIRALEIAELSGKNPTDWHRERESLASLGFEPIVIGISKERAELYKGIEGRVDQMFRRGLVQEVIRISKKRFSKTAAQAVGYREVLDTLRQDRPIDQEVKDLIKKNTRHLAKRQLTWFKREAGIKWFVWQKGESVKAMTDRIFSALKEDQENHAAR